MTLKEELAENYELYQDPRTVRLASKRIIDEAIKKFGRKKVERILTQVRKEKDQWSLSGAESSDNE